MSVTLGDAILYLSANPDALNRDLKKADSKIKRFANGAKNILGSALKAGMIGAGIAIAAGIGILTKSVFEAADAGEAMAKFSATFGDAAGFLIDDLDELAEMTGRSRYELRASAADFGAVTKALGFTESGAADMSSAALKMAVDLGAFHNLPTEDVAKRIRKALTGETESMKELGVVVNANRIKQELLNMGYEDNLATIDETVKAQAIFNIIQRQTTDAVGIARAESSTFTGQVVALKAAWSDFMVDVGSQLLPMLTPLLASFGEWARVVLPLVVTWVGEKLVPALMTFAEFISTSVIPAMTTMGDWIKDKLIPALQEFGTWIQDNVVPVIETLAAWIMDTLVPALKEMWVWFEENLLPVIVAVADVISAVLVKAFEGLTGLWENILQPALEGLFEWFDKLLAPIDGVSGALERVTDWLHDVAEKIRNLKLPDWLTPGSPTPFEKGLRGMAKALEKELTPQLGKFAMQLQGAGAGTGLGTQTTNYDQSRTTRVDQLNINNGRDEQGVMQVLRNMSRI